MAQYKVLQTFRDTHSKEIYEENQIIEISVKRAKEIEKNLDGSFIERIEESEMIEETID